MIKCVLFDMDGTLVNTYEGIYHSYEYALKNMNLKFDGNNFVGKVIGAPLLSVFKEHFLLPEEDVMKAIEYYRKYYSTFGKRQVEMYNGLENVLIKLKNKGFLLGVATLKRETFAKEILNNLNLYQYFDIVYGIDENDKLKKADLILKCINYLNVYSNETILVGDSEYDMVGAQEAGTNFLGVLYGYGFKGVKCIGNFVESTSQIYDYIIQNFTKEVTRY